MMSESTDVDRLMCGMLTKRRRETASESPYAQAMAAAETRLRRHLEQAAHTPWVQQRPEEYLRLLERALAVVLAAHSGA
jgi:hypothetical protein